MCDDHIYRRGCNTPETAEHILLHCPFYDKERSLINSYFQAQGFDVSLRTFLTSKQISRKVEHLLASFLDACKT